LEQSSITWHGVELNKPDWSENSHSIALTANSLRGDTAIHYLINAHYEPLDFELPKKSPKIWKRWIDTSLESPNDICMMADATAYTGATYKVGGRSIAVFVKHF
jgi:glycogen operon protein